MSRAPRRSILTFLVLLVIIFLMSFPLLSVLETLIAFLTFVWQDSPMNAFDMVLQIFFSVSAKFVTVGALNFCITVHLQMEVQVLILEKPLIAVDFHAFESRVTPVQYFVFLQFTGKCKCLVALITFQIFLVVNVHVSSQLKRCIKNISMQLGYSY